MRRLCSLLGLSLVLAACRIEPTPEQYIDPIRATEDVSTTEAEIRSRLTEIADVLRDGSLQALTATLSPHPDGVVIGFDTQRLFTTEQLAALLQRQVGGEQWTIRDVSVIVDSGNRVAWFVSRFFPSDASVGDRVSAGFDFSGVYLREAGEWRLIQGHLSRHINE